MRKTMIPIIVCLMVLCCSLCAEVKADAATYSGLLKNKAPSIATVKFVMKLKISMMGQVQENESNTEVQGAVVHEDGLIMVSNTALNPHFGIGGASVSATPSNIQILFEGDEKEYDAIVGAVDSKLGLAFLLINGWKGNPFQPLISAKLEASRLAKSMLASRALQRDLIMHPTSARSW